MTNSGLVAAESRWELQAGTSSTRWSGTAPVEAYASRFGARRRNIRVRSVIGLLGNIPSLCTSMKRPREDSSDAPSPSGPNNAATERPPAKRNKASRACTSCRKHKTRCELFEPSSPHSRCHRCDVLSIACSFETNAPSNLVVDNPPVTNARRHILKPAFSAPERDPNKCDEPTCEPTQSELLGSTPRSNMVSPWEFHKVPGIPDWTAAPMMAMLTLSKMMASKDRPTVRPVTNTAFTEVLSCDQRQHLLALCVTTLP